MMKNLFFILVLSLTSICQLGAQTLEVPEITSVSVDTISGKPVVKWKLQHPELVDGYIVKRLIVDGNGVISGTYNNVEVIESNSVFSYTDNSNAYGTSAKPSERKEFYRISSYKIQNGQTIYSLMSNEASTILLSGSFDNCENSFNFNFSSYDAGTESVTYCLRSGFPKSSKYVVTKDTICSFSFDDFQLVRNFAVECILPNGESAYSPVIEIKSEEVIAPDKIEISCVTVNSDNALELVIDVTQSKSTKQLLLLRSNHSAFVTDTIPLNSTEFNNYHFVDEIADVSTVYEYTIAAINECGKVIAFSNPANNIVLQVSVGTENTNVLDWNPIAYWQNGVENYKIFRSVDGSDLEEVNSVNFRYSEYTESLSNMIANSDIYEGRFCYQISAVAASGGVEAKSQLSCIDREPVVYIPNALNPKSTNSENWEFKPKADFLKDYKLVIYDKRGENIFESAELSKGWDGTNRKGKLCPMDTYIYQISYKSSANKIYKKNGYVNLVY